VSNHSKKNARIGTISDAEREQRIARLMAAGKRPPAMTPEERVKFVTSIRIHSVPPFEDTTPLIRRDRDER
jgi:hypothetical protein